MTNKKRINIGDAMHFLLWALIITIGVHLCFVGHNSSLWEWYLLPALLAIEIYSSGSRSPKRLNGQGLWSKTYIQVTTIVFSTMCAISMNLRLSPWAYYSSHSQYISLYLVCSVLAGMMLAPVLRRYIRLVGQKRIRGEGAVRAHWGHDPAFPSGSCESHLVA